jgi:hypothetical protein
MEIKVGNVRSNIDLFKSGRITVAWDEYPLGIGIKYVSPFTTVNNIGFMAIPEVGTDVLICKPANKNDWYYLGSIIENNFADGAGEGKVIDEGVKNPFNDLYRFRGVVPQAYIFSSPKGNKIMLSDGYNPDGSYIGTHLETSRGMRLSLDDSTGTITLGNSTNNAMLVLTENSMADQTAMGGPASFSVQVTGNVSITSQQGDLDLTVINGRTINIENKSGLGSGAGNDSRTGNINILSKNGDVNIVATGQNQEIRLESNGEGGDVVINAKDTIVMTAANGIIMQSTGGDIDISGNKIYLN